MWLLDTRTYQLHEFIGLNTPAYAILSHVWGNEEVTFGDMLYQTAEVQRKAGYHKIRAFCDHAYTRHECTFAWADTACIDKRSSAELNENINSMFAYYIRAQICVIYLADVMSTTDKTAFASSRWFTRGWTLQELLASSRREFRTTDWKQITGATLRHDVNAVCATRTGIDLEILRSPHLIRECCIAERMSWAARRKTTRPEDRAYSLMGLFNVNMSVLYGEGEHRAFARLQSEIMKTSFDQSLFAWRVDRFSDVAGLLARSPADFIDCPKFALRHPERSLAPFAQTNVGIFLRLQVLSESLRQGDLDSRNEIDAALQLDVKTASGWMNVTIRLK